ncbi:MAG: EipA family protein [Pseudomonadota bacterium]
MRVRNGMLWAMVALLGVSAMPAAAQEMTKIDPNTAIDSDLDTPAPARDSAQPQDYSPPPLDQNMPAPATPSAAPPVDARALAQERVKAADTFDQQELVVAAEGVFGKGASGLAGIIENILKDQGRPNAYIAGGEGGAAIGVGLRYGKGDLFHKIEGQRPVYWTGPSVGFDLGGDASKVFVLVYNLYDSQDLYKRFPAGEGRAYFVGGFSAAYMRRGDVVLIPVRLGVGWRIGINAGYMKFSEKRRIVPF